MIKTLPKGLYKSARGQVVATILQGSMAGKSFALGDCELTRSISSEYDERYSNEYAVKTLAYRELDQMSGELKLKLFQSSKVALMMANLSDAHIVDQPAAQGLEVTVANTDGTEVIPLNRKRVTNVVVSDGAGQAYVEGEHYVLDDGEDGNAFVSLFGKPAGAGADTVVDFDCLAARGDRYFFGESAELMVGITFVESIKATTGRSREVHVYHQVGMTPDGDLTLIGGDTGPREISITGKLYPDPTRPAGQQLGYIDTNWRAAA